MNRFEEELKNNNLVCSECSTCNKVIWPPSEFCKRCFKESTWKQVSRSARLVEFSRKNDDLFCIAELENGIRLMGSIASDFEPKIGQELYLARCDYDGTERFFFQPVSKT